MSAAKRSRRLGWAIAASLAGTALLIFLIVAVVTLVSRDTRQDINLADLARSGTEVVAIEGMREDTSQLCVGKSGCVQAYSADHAEIFKFSSREDAYEFAERSPSAYQSNWIVISFADESLTGSERQAVQHYLDSLATSD
ncbi:hypothetical protein [Microbacterium esteraromaticum]|uniref:hypothetical protein n=1 Tax=Microbacterium esteraromaticum TaxID=57043 RepID=UPI000B351CDC|nr:hypothetical protein [Microbacterium esteraromaticum]